MTVLAALAIWLLASVLVGLLAGRFFQTFRSAPYPETGRDPVTLRHSHMKLQNLWGGAEEMLAKLETGLLAGDSLDDIERLAKEISTTILAADVMVKGRNGNCQ